MFGRSVREAEGAGGDWLREAEGAGGGGFGRRLRAKGAGVSEPTHSAVVIDTIEALLA